VLRSRHLVPGSAVAGADPPDTKLLAGRFREGRGFAIGVFVGTLTVGIATPRRRRRQPHSYVVL